MRINFYMMDRDRDMLGKSSIVIDKIEKLNYFGPYFRLEAHIDIETLTELRDLIDATGCDMISLDDDGLLLSDSDS